jgi:hypothetical protein
MGFQAPECCGRRMRAHDTEKDGAFFACSVCGKKTPHPSQDIETDIETVTVDHEFDLTTVELLDVGNKLGELDVEGEQIDAQKKTVMAEFNAKLKRISAEVKRHTMMLRTGTEVRPVECGVFYEGGMRRLVSIETGELIEEREMTNEEKQLELF